MSRVLITLAVVLTLVGCESEPSQPPMAPPVVTPVPKYEAHDSPGNPLPAEETPEAPTSSVPSATEAEVIAATKRLDEAQEGFARALNEATAIDADSPCEASYQGMIVLLENLQKQFGAPSSQTGELPDRAEYLRLCRQLPPEAQRCTALGYAQQHREECDQLREDPVVRAKIQQLMAGARARRQAAPAEPSE